MTRIIYKIISRIIVVLLKRKKLIACKKDEQHILKLHKEYIDLNNREKKIINKYNRQIAKIMKNIYFGWNDCSKEYFISDYYFQLYVLPVLNNINFREFGINNGKSYFSDKNYQERFSECVQFPKCIIRCINGAFYDHDFKLITNKEAKKLLNKYPKAVFKISIGSCHGKGVELVERENYNQKLKEYGNNYIVQDLIRQHDFLSNFNNTSVNVIRVTSVFWKDEVYILSAILRVGPPGSFCDHTKNEKYNPRIVAVDNKSGYLYGNAIEPDDGFVYEDIFGKKICGQIPNFNEIIKIVKKQHLKFAHHKIIGWDFSIDENEKVICIEYNSYWPGIIQSQMACGPIFSLKTKDGNVLLDEIISEGRDENE